MLNMMTCDNICKCVYIYTEKVMIVITCCNNDNNSNTIYIIITVDNNNEQNILYTIIIHHSFVNVYYSCYIYTYMYIHACYV